MTRRSCEPCRISETAKRLALSGDGLRTPGVYLDHLGTTDELVSKSPRATLACPPNEMVPEALPEGSGGLIRTRVSYGTWLRKVKLVSGRGRFSEALAWHEGKVRRRQSG